MKDYHVPIVLIISMLITSLFIIGCGEYYEEGDEIAKQRFEKMTVQETALYESVQNKWGQKPLKGVRDAIARRQTRPDESELPFKDLANVIKTNNTVSLKVNTSNKASIQNKYILCKWDRIDEDWYRTLMLSVGIDNVVKQKLLPEEEVIKDKPLTQKEKDLKYIGNGLKEINVLLDERQKDDTKDIVPKSKYDDIFYDIRKCDEAIDMYNQIIGERLLNWEDYDLLIRISTKCKAIQIGEKLTTWKN